MEEMVEVARSLREDHRFNGYIHLKAVAGCSQLLLDQAGKYADRLSANIELPVQKDLDQLAPAKSHREIETSMSHIASKITETKEPSKTRAKAPVFSPGGQSTQMIVGATPSSDQDILKTSTHLYKKYGLKRVYYSAFSPIPDSDPKLPLKSPPLIREHRLYQADWLMRSYGFQAKELTSEAEPNLDLEIDPKLSWALRHRAFFPVDVNTASREELLRIPGLGVRNIERILNIRRFHQVTLADLAKMRVPMDRAKYFLTASDSNPSAHLLDRPGLVDQIVRPATQLELFEVRSGEF
jgi:putative DNA modification/repair radical SAM protein